MEDVFDMDHLKAVSGGKGVDFDKKIKRRGTAIPD